MADLLGIGKSGLFASKKSLETTGHNLANVNTEGYSRQKIVQATSNPNSVGGLIMGTGVTVKGVQRFDDSFVQRRLESATNSQKFFESRSGQLNEIETIFNEIDNEGLNQILNRFFNSFRELANQPENETIRSVVRDNASLVVKDFKRIRDTLDGQVNNINQLMEKTVLDINTILHHVSDVNDKIQQLEMQQGETGDLRDQRDLYLKQLSEHFKLHTYIDEKNRFVITAQGIGTLVTGPTVLELQLSPVSKEDSSNNRTNSYEIFLKDRPSQPITNKFSGGTLAALAKVRNEDIKKLQDDVDNIAYDFSKAVNAVHRRGYVNRKIEMSDSRGPASVDKKGPTTGINFFNDIENREGAASKIDLSDLVKQDLSNITTSIQPNSPGDNRIAIAISKIQHEKMLGEGTITLEEKYLQTVGNVGLETGKAKLDAEQASGLLAQAHNIRERLAGVSIDEETANMVRFQHAYEASAKIMQTADEMFKTIIDLKR